MNISILRAVEEFMISDEMASLADSTRSRSRMVLRELSTVVGQSTSIAALGRRDVDATVMHWRGEVTDASLNAYRTDLRRFGKWLAANRYVKADPAAHLHNTKTKTQASKRKPIDGGQAALLVKVAEARHPRDGMTALIMLSTGLRDSEVCGLQWRYVDYEAATFTAWRPKLRDWHTAPWSSQLAEAMAEWRRLTIERHGPIQPGWHVVPALAHRHISGMFRMDPEWPMVPTNKQTQLRSRVKRWLIAVGETDLHGRASHTLRRTAANLLIESGGDIRDAQTMLGHASVSMTENYLDVNIARAKLAERVKGFRL